MRELMEALIKSLIANGVKVPAEEPVCLGGDKIAFGNELDTVFNLDFSEHDKKVTEEKDAQIRELKRQIEDLEAIIADGKKPDISVSENGVSVGCECGGYHFLKQRISQLEEQHNTERTRIKVLLREIHGIIN